MHRVFPVTSVGSVRQPFRHPAMVNPLSGWLGPQSGLLAGGRSAGRRDLLFHVLALKNRPKDPLCQSQEGPVVLNPFDPCLLAWKVSCSVDDVESSGMVTEERQHFLLPPGLQVKSSLGSEAV